MLETILGRVPEFIKKDFLFASFLPAVLFVSALVTTLGGVLGAGQAWELYAGLSPLETTLLLTSAGIALVVLAYVLSALRGAFVGFWSGETRFPGTLLWGFFQLGKLWQEHRYRALRAASRPRPVWREVDNWFQAESGKHWKAAGSEIPGAELDALRALADRLYPGLGPEQVKRELGQLHAALGKYSGESLRGVYEDLRRCLLDWDDASAARVRNTLSELDREFGEFPSIRPTRLGNIICSYQQYASTRYRMDASAFWPRLLSVIPESYREVLEEPRIVLDFAVTLASLAACYGLLAIAAGPWLWMNPLLWGLLSLLASGVAAFGYRLAVVSAGRHGDVVRAAFDLYRLDLLKQLNRPRPATFLEERKRWEEVSRLAVFGDHEDFPLAGEGPP